VGRVRRERFVHLVQIRQKIPVKRHSSLLGELNFDQPGLRLHVLPHYIKKIQEYSNTYQCVLSIISRCEWFCRKSSIRSIRIHPTGVAIFEQRKSACHQQDGNEANPARRRYSLSHNHHCEKVYRGISSLWSLN
jgi:hypothetical protein